MKKVKVFSYSDLLGGASIAAMRQVSSLAENKKFSISWYVSVKFSSQSIVNGSSKKSIHFHSQLMKRIISYFLVSLQLKNKSKYKCSLNLFSDSFLKSKIKKKKNNIHLHWFQNDSISIYMLYRILKNKNNNVIITMHDDWLIGGVEHCLESDDIRFSTGYNLGNSSVISSVLFLVKKHLFNTSKCNLLITVPSGYLCKKIDNSIVLKGVRKTVVPNLLDLKMFYPREEVSNFVCKENYDGIFFVSCVIPGNYLKGYDRFERVVDCLKVKYSNNKYLFVRVGASEEKLTVDGNVSIQDYGYVKDPDILSSLYSLCDLTLIFSRSESFGQVAIESLACGTPVVTYRGTGVDELLGEYRGSLVEPDNYISFAQTVNCLIERSLVEKNIDSEKCVDFIVTNFDQQHIGRVWETNYNAMFD